MGYRTYWFHDHKLYSHHYIAYASLLKEMNDYELAMFYYNIALEKVWPHMDMKAEAYFNMGCILDDCRERNVMLKDNKGYEYELNGIGWYFKEAAALNEKMYGMFYQEYVEHHGTGNELPSNMNDTVRNDNSFSKSTTAYNPGVCNMNDNTQSNKYLNEMQNVESEKLKFKSWMNG